jgi:hypothetical protein
MFLQEVCKTCAKSAGIDAYKPDCLALPIFHLKYVLIKPLATAFAGFRRHMISKSQMM